MSEYNLLIDACPKDNLDFLLACARDLNRRLQARLSGVCYTWPKSSPVGALVASPLSAMHEEARMTAHLAGARSAFQAAFAETGLPVAWYEGIGEPTDHILHQLYCADLLATIESSSGPCTQADPIDLAVRSGTPVLRIQHGLHELPLRTAVVAWKDCPSANRALRASRPLLALAERIYVIGVGDEISRERLEQIAAFLNEQGLKADAEHLPSAHSNPGTDIMGQAFAWEADLVISGVKGERSLRERLLGDVTDKLAGYAGFSWLMCA